ncbi:MAG: class I SAM-dependent methyltransferase [Chitinispirillales bacterium]|jgi:SAM-dependent methyltransferase|nr:class I SAM-dependent methyltransferase [Chitinispirillales bacterium]
MDLLEKTQNQNRHPWEISRANRIFNLISGKKIINYNNIVDIGAGDCYFTEKFKEISLPPPQIFAIDIGYTQDDKLKSESIKLLSFVDDLPKEFHKNGENLFVMMDVLEHIENDDEFLGKIYNFLSENGILLITVPAWQFLFSSHDKFLKHYRRYKRKQLKKLLISNNFNVQECRYFYFSLFFLRLISGFIAKINRSGSSRKINTGIGNWRFSQNHPITKFITIILDIDFCICRIFAKFNIFIPGLSLLAICTKRSDKNI